MGARNASEVMSRFRNQPSEIWYRGARITDVTVEPGLANGARTLAGLYDYQWKEQDVMLEPAPRNGEKVNRSYSISKDCAGIIEIGKAMHRSAEYSMGMLGREPAYVNRAISAFAGSADFFSRDSGAFSQNIKHYHAYIRDEDLSLTHTLLNPRPNKLVGPAFQEDPEIALHVSEERDDGIVISGARMLATLPIADEIAIFPAFLRDSSVASLKYAFAGAIPCASPGLRFLCRDSFDYGYNAHDHPLGARYEEMDAVVIFDRVFVPWERVFCYRDIDACHQIYSGTGAGAHMAYQVVCKNIAKTEYLLGLTSLMIDGAGLESFSHVQEKLAEIWINLEVLKAFRRASEVDATINPYGMSTPAWDPLDAARNLYPKMYPRMIEIVQQLGASGLVAMPTLSDVEGPLSKEIERYFQSARMESIERISLYRLAWDTAISAFATRQVLYERFFFGDPVQMAGSIARGKDRSEVIERVRSFLREIY